MLGAGCALKSKFPILIFRNISKKYDEEQVIQNANFLINNSEFVAILGPSGCGKTTILRLVGGFENPDSGEIIIHNLKINDIPPFSRKINTVFQHYALFPHMNIFDNISFGLIAEGKDRLHIKKEVCEIAEKIGLNGLLFKFPNQLSGGQKQRVSIARAVIKKPHILLLDEPLGALDRKLRQKMHFELKKLQKDLGITFLFVTHDQEEALSIADKIMIMNDGKIEQFGIPKDIYEFPGNLFVAQFIGEINILEAEIIYVSGKNITLFIENEIVYTTTSNAHFLIGDKVCIAFRPEDITIKMVYKIDILKSIFIAKLESMTYKGATLESIMVMQSGKKIKVSEFFNEDSSYPTYKIKANILINWISGWEVIIKYEK